MKFLFTILFPSQFSVFKIAWKEAWSYVAFRFQFFFTLAILALIAMFIPQFFSYIQSVQGYRINDLILNYLPVSNMSLYIFLLIYLVILISMINLGAHPFLFLRLLQAYCLLVMARIFCLYSLPLEPKQSIIPLEDPFVGHLFYKGSMITKDLFFSGHVSTMFLLLLFIPSRFLKITFMIATLLVAAFILIQHVHYTIDVVAAPIFSWICYKVVFSLIPNPALI